MAKLITPILFISCCLYYACTDDCTGVVLVERQPIDPCENVNPVACSFEFREGKWLEILDSVYIGLTVEDTIWFKQDSLIGWSSQGEPYEFLKGYFIGNYIFTQSRGSDIDDPVSIDAYTSYNDSTEILTIEWTAGLQTINYKKID
jgi:hypothetical protein